MTTRDPRSRVPQQPDSGPGPVREVTASLSIDLGEVPPVTDDEDDRVSHPSLAVGTGLPSDVSSSSRNSATAIASPSGRNRTPAPKDTKPPAAARSGSEADDQIGTVLGTYKLVELLGKGGMGYVYRAEHTKLGREVALKLLRGDYAKRRDAVLRFFQEAKTVNRVRHRNIVDVTDFVELDDGTTFIIMELLQGKSLGKWARGGIALPRALAVLVQICDGLGAAHAVGVVHRDLKPDNVIVIPTSDGAELVKLLDFGVAKLVNRDDEDVGFQTAAGSVIGTPAYMSPEQAGGMNVDHRSDIYSLGAIMYELFCGHPMFRGRSFGEYVRKHLTEVPVPPRQTQGGAGMDERLEALILKCLSKEPSLRFANIQELRDGLMHLLGGIETQPPGSVSIPMPPPARTTPGVAPPPPMQTLPGSSIHSLSMSQYTLAPDTVAPGAAPWRLWLIGGAVAIGLGIVGAVWYGGRASGSGPSAAKQRGPTASPIDVPEAPSGAAAQKHVELRFDSLPAGGVYADGRSAELCTTPCSVQVDLSDGGPTDKRTFVVRADGYEDKRVDVDFLVSQRDFSVSLTRLPGAPNAGSGGDQSSQIVDAAKEPGDARKGGKKSRKGRKGKATVKDTETKAEPVKIEEPPPPPPPPEPKVEPKTPPKKIDRTDTIDPFKK